MDKQTNNWEVRRCKTHAKCRSGATVSNHVLNAVKRCLLPHDRNTSAGIVSGTHGAATPAAMSSRQRFIECRQPIKQKSSIRRLDRRARRRARGNRGGSGG